jgi:predicted alpha/beta hydrolase family esterase
LKKKKTNKIPLALRIIPVVFPWVEKLLPWVANRFLVHVFFTPFKYPIPERELVAAQSAQWFAIKVNGRKIQCYGWGNGSTVLLVHGWAGRGLQLLKFIEPLLTLGYRVVAMDGPSHGRSEGSKTNLDEFKAALQQVVEVEKNVCAIVAHSFGGIASLYAISEGLPVKNLINIASPTIGDEIIKTYLRAINGSAKTAEAFKQYVLKKSGRKFDDFTALEFIKRVPDDFNLLLVYDDEDKEVIIQHAYALLKVYPKAGFFKTTGLGHTRILRNDEVVKRIVTFVHDHSSKQ